MSWLFGLPKEAPKAKYQWLEDIPKANLPCTEGLSIEFNGKRYIACAATIFGSTSFRFFEVTEELTCTELVFATDRVEVAAAFRTEYPSLKNLIIASGGAHRTRARGKATTPAAAKWLPTGRTVVHKGVTRKVWVSAKDATVKAVKRVVKSADGSRKVRYNLLSRGEGASGARPLRP